MIGSTILMTKEPHLLMAIESIGNLNNFIHLELERMITLDFEILVDRGGVKWAESSPIVYLPDDGIAILKIDERGLSYILGLAIDENSEYQEDLHALVTFANLHGTTDLYELATF